jgi:hypothetical protein
VVKERAAADFGLAVREARLNRDEARPGRVEGRPWLHDFMLWPGLLGTCLGWCFVGLDYFEGSCRALTGDCLHQVPYWDLAVVILLLSVPEPRQ